MPNFGDRRPVNSNLRCIAAGVGASALTAIMLFALAAAAVSAEMIKADNMMPAAGAVMLISAFLGVLFGRRYGKLSPALAFVEVCAVLVIIISLISIFSGGRGAFHGGYLISILAVVCGGFLACLMSSRKRRRRR